jgi:exopolysaccharide production protein ExoZ
MVFYALAAAIVPFGGVRALALTLAGLAVLGWQLGNPWSFHLVSTTQADFLAGVLVFLGSGVFRNIGSAVPIATGLVLLTYTRSHDFPFATPICMAILLVGMVNLRLPWHRQPFRLLVLAGDASYSIYLLHYIVFLIAAMASVRLGFTLPTWVCEPFRFAAIAACCLISYLTWRVIERPMIRFGNQLSRTRSVKVQPA